MVVIFVKRLVVIICIIILLPCVCLAEEITELEVLLDIKNGINDINDKIDSIDNMVYGEDGHYERYREIINGVVSEEGLIKEVERNIVGAIMGLENIESLQEYVNELVSIKEWLEHIGSVIYTFAIIFVPIFVIVILGWFILRQFL